MFVIILLNVIYIQKMSQQPTPQKLEDKVYSRQQYARATFWQDRYVQNGGFFDWYAEYPELVPSFKEYGIVPEYKILMVGCGNSKLSDQMYQNGYKNIINIDISPTVIDQMKEKFPYMVWQVMDATKMSYKDGQFDVILDKGTLDALISGKNYDICELMLKECIRVTKESGQLILITYGSPEGRRKIFENALPFDDYDYYQCRAELNDMSTMINLMRSNLPGQQLRSILTQQEALTKTMKEFTIIKMMRRSRKNQKQYIVWKKHAKAQIQFNSAHLQQPSNELKPQLQEKRQIKQSQKQEAQKEKVQEKQTFNYQPKKQPYVYVYSIRPKFTLGIDRLLQEQTQQTLHSKWVKQENGDMRIDGNPDQPSLTFLAQQKLQKNILKAIRFLQRKNISYPSILLTSSPERSLNGSLKINAVEEKSSNMLCLRKTNVQLVITLNEKDKLENVLAKLKNISIKLNDKCSIDPSPKTYALFSVLKNRKILPTVNELLKVYWFPTWKIAQYTEQSLTLQVSLPPVIKAKQDELITTLRAQLKPLKVIVSAVLPGFISYIDLQLNNIVSAACLSYTNQRTNLVVDDFWVEDDVSHAVKPQNYLENTLYNEIAQTITLAPDVTEKVIAHIVGLY